MPFVLYNTFSKKEEPFDTIEKGIVRMYTCGPTVYGRPHIGNYSSFLMADLLRRWLEVGHGYTVRHVKNITDVGHLLHDADSGDDKIQKQAEKEKLHPLEIARRYTEQYLEDEKALNFLEPESRPRASEYVKQMIEIINTLLQKKHAYETDDGIYFAVTSFPQYGALSGNTLEHLSAGARIEVDEKKKHPADFALWKKCVGDNGRHVLRWTYATGDVSKTEGEDPLSGFPGWHIECSAMSRSLLGDQMDLHTGGEDNIFPHHECEIAQSESCTGKSPFVRHWLHKRRIDLGDAKMSKSLGNIITLEHLTERGYSPLDLRYYLLSVHYRTNLKFAWKGMDDARAARRSLTDWIARDGVGESQSGKKVITAAFVEDCVKAFDKAMDSDLNVPGALASVFNCYHEANASKAPDESARSALAAFTKKIRATFGCFEPETESVPAEVQKLVDERAAARQSKDFAASDRLRDAIATLGYEVKDTAEGQKVRRK